MEKTQQYDILSLIPQRPPFIAVDRIDACDKESAHSSFLVRDDHILVEDGCLSEAGLIENMAQTAAAREGLINKGKNKIIHIGYIGDVKNLEIAALPLVDDVLETEILVKNQIFDITVVEGKVKCHNKILASCEMKIFISNKS